MVNAFRWDGIGYWEMWKVSKFLAVYDGNPAKMCQPTDLWSGYGFSNSLPAEILKTEFDMPENSFTNHCDYYNMLSTDN